MLLHPALVLQILSQTYLTINTPAFHYSCNMSQDIIEIISLPSVPFGPTAPNRSITSICMQPPSQTDRVPGFRAPYSTQPFL